MTFLSVLRPPSISHLLFSSRPSRLSSLRLCALRPSSSSSSPPRPPPPSTMTDLPPPPASNGAPSSTSSQPPAPAPAPPVALSSNSSHTQPSRVADLRVNYSHEPLLESALPDSPYPLFAKWVDEATRANEHEPNAMCLSTVDDHHRPSARMVLLKDHDTRGFVWYTNFTSRKASQLKGNPYAALTFWWPTLQRSVRVEGVTRTVDEAQSDLYFNSRPVSNRLGAWASNQSSPIPDRTPLEQKWAKLQEEYLEQGEGEKKLKKPLDRPQFWGGYRLVPQRVEFWKGRPARLHDRIVFERQSDIDQLDKQQWTKIRLEP